MDNTDVHQAGVLPVAAKRPVPVITAVARFWSANMDLIHSKGSVWPGFSYSDDEKLRMHEIAEGMPVGQFVFTMALVVLLVFLFIAAVVALMIWHILHTYGGDLSHMSPSEFIFCLVLLLGTMFAGGFPFSVLGACWITGRMFSARPADMPDGEFSRQLFAKLVHQLIRMGIIVCGIQLVYLVFVPMGSKREIIVRMVLPALGMVTSVLTLMYYGSGRSTTSKAPS